MGFKRRTTTQQDDVRHAIATKLVQSYIDSISADRMPAELLAEEHELIDSIVTTFGRIIDSYQQAIGDMAQKHKREIDRLEGMVSEFTKDTADRPVRTMAVMKGLRVLAKFSDQVNARQQHNVARATEWLDRIEAYDAGDPIPQRARRIPDDSG